MKKYLTLEDLCNYYSSIADNATFDSKEAQGEIVVQIPAVTEFEQNENISEGLVPVKIKACHTGVNINRYEISSEVMTNALGTFINKPILGFIHEVDGVPQFYRHNHHEENGEIVYEEYPVGVIPESGNPHLEHDDGADVDRVIVDGLLFSIYSKAAEIVAREGKCDVSIEASIKKMKYDVTRKVLTVEDFVFSGVTILGVDEEGNKIDPGMAGSDVTLTDFSAENNSVFDEKVNGLVNSAMADFHKNLSEKGGETIMTKEFSISHEDIRCALYGLLDSEERPVWINAVYDDYCVFEDWNAHLHYKQGYSKSEDTVELVGEAVEVTAEWLTAEEVQAVEALRQELAEAKTATENLQTELSVANEKLANYEAEPSKMELFNKYDEVLSDNVEFNNLKKTEAHFTLSLEDISSKIDSIILEKAKTSMFEKNTNENAPSVGSKPLIAPTKVQGRYGDIFSKR